MQITVTCDIAARPDIVFATALDVTHWADFIRGIDSVQLLTAGPVGQGTRLRETRTMFGRSATEELTVEQIDPPRRFVMTAHNHGTAYHVDHIFSAHDNGTRMVQTFQGRPTTMAARLLAPLGWLMAGSVRSMLAADLDDVRREAERRASEAV